MDLLGSMAELELPPPEHPWPEIELLSPPGTSMARARAPADAGTSMDHRSSRRHAGVRISPDAVDSRLPHLIHIPHEPMRPPEMGTTSGGRPPLPPPTHALDPPPVCSLLLLALRPAATCTPLSGSCSCRRRAPCYACEDKEPLAKDEEAASPLWLLLQEDPPTGRGEGERGDLPPRAPPGASSRDPPPVHGGSPGRCQLAGERRRRQPRATHGVHRGGGGGHNSIICSTPASSPADSRAASWSYSSTSPSQQLLAHRRSGGCSIRRCL